MFWFFLALRLASLLLMRAWMFPDEYWKCLAAAHRLAFGYGYLNWQWTTGLRSHLYPGLTAVMYKVLALLSFDSVGLLTQLPGVLQALLGAYADFRFYVWSNKSKWAAFVLATSWFWFYVGSRTLANPLEMSLTMVALSYFPWASESTGFLWLVGLSFFMNPASVIPWIPLCLYHIKKSSHPAQELLLKRYVVIGLVTGTLSVGVDSYFRGSVVFTSYEFLKYNLLGNVGSYDKEQPWYWYVTNVLPTMLGFCMFPFLLASYETVRYRKVYKRQAVLLCSVFFTVIMYSLNSYKEFRSLLPVLPMCLYVSANYLSRWSRKASRKMIWLSVILIVGTHWLVVRYLGLDHQRTYLSM